MDGRASKSQAERIGNALYNRVNVKHWATITQVIEQALEKIEQIVSAATGLFYQHSLRSLKSEHVRQFFEKTEFLQSNPWECYASDRGLVRCKEKRNRSRLPYERQKPW